MAALPADGVVLLPLPLSSAEEAFSVVVVLPPPLTLEDLAGLCTALLVPAGSLRPLPLTLGFLLPGYDKVPLAVACWWRFLLLGICLGGFLPLFLFTALAKVWETAGRHGEVAGEPRGAGEDRWLWARAECGDGPVSRHGGESVIN